jgi:hypothetical protein
VKGSSENPWSELFAEFSAKIKEHIGEVNHSNIVASFSTTGPIERAANEIVMMDTLKSYFEYKVMSLCGIPEVKLEGTIDDWNELSHRTKVLGDTYGLDWWTNRIVPTLERIARNVAGADDPDLWKSIYKFHSRSGGDYINGWIVDFFPYLQIGRVERPNWTFGGQSRSGIEITSLPGSLCIAPFTWQFLTISYKMEFVAGFIGFTQDAHDFAVRPKIGWAVREV